MSKIRCRNGYLSHVSHVCVSGKGQSQGLAHNRLLSLTMINCLTSSRTYQIIIFINNIISYLMYTIFTCRPNIDVEISISTAPTFYSFLWLKLNKQLQAVFYCLAVHTVRHMDSPLASLHTKLYSEGRKTDVILQHLSQNSKMKNICIWHCLWHCLFFSGCFS